MLSNILATPGPSPGPSINESNSTKVGRSKYATNETKKHLDLSTTTFINEVAFQCTKEKESCKDKILRRVRFEKIVK